jgi:hypothetical protein
MVPAQLGKGGRSDRIGTTLKFAHRSPCKGGQLSVGAVERCERVVLLDEG